MARPKIYTPQHIAQIAVNTETPATATELGLPYPIMQEALEAKVLRPVKAKRYTGRRGKPALQYIPTIKARSLAKAA